jgi:hypothetical protein
MMYIMHCENCKAESVPPDKVRVSVKLDKTYNHCDHCHHSSTSHHDLWFCSDSCLKEWMGKGQLDVVVAKFVKDDMWSVDKHLHFGRTRKKRSTMDTAG